MSRRAQKSQQERSRDLVVRFNRLIEALPIDEAIATVAHYILGVRHVKTADYLGVSPRKAQRLAAAGMRKMRDNIRKQNLRAEDPAALWDFNEAEVRDSLFVRWLAREFDTKYFWAPYITWITELISGVENRPCQMCGAPVYGDDLEQEIRLAPLNAEIGRPRKFCSNTCRQRHHYWKRYLDGRGRA